MRQPREHQFDPSNPPWLHCISRCVRRAFLCGEGLEHRKAWLERRLRLLSRCFAVEVGGYAIMSNHLHAVVRPRPQQAAALSDEEVALAWWFVRHDVDPEAPEPDADVAQRPSDASLSALMDDASFIARWRSRLGSVSWFMKSLKEPLSRMANREDGCTGAFWEGRFQSIPLLDQAAIVACLAYVDLNPIRAQLAEFPEASAYTSVRTRIRQRQARAEAADQRRAGARGRATQTLRAADLATSASTGSRRAMHRSPDDERVYRSWLTPIAELTSSGAGDPGWRLDSYLELVEATGRLIRGDKRGSIPANLPGLLARLDDGRGRGLSVDQWRASVARPRGLRGTALGSAVSLTREAARRGLAWLQVRCALFRAAATDSSMIQ